MLWLNLTAFAKCTKECLMAWSIFGCYLWKATNWERSQKAFFGISVACRSLTCRAIAWEPFPKIFSGISMASTASTCRTMVWRNCPAVSGREAMLISFCLFERMTSLPLLFNWPRCVCVCVRVCVCVKAPRNTVLHLEIALWQKQERGAQAHCGYLCQRSYSTMGEAQPDQLCVPAIRIWNCWQAVPLRCLPALRLNSMSVRSMSVSISTNFDNFQLQIRSVFDPNFRLRFSLNSTSATYDNLVCNFSPMNGFFRTIFNICVNWGLWDNLSLPRTTPDNHVELSSVCVSPPGATSSRLDGPSEKVQVQKNEVDVSKQNKGGHRAMD